MKVKICLSMIVILLIYGCTGSFPQVKTEIEQPISCKKLYAHLDGLIYHHRVEDTGEYKIPNFPYLRSTRFLASYSDETLSPPAYRQWLELLRLSDERARLIEFSNLPIRAKQSILARISHQHSIKDELQHCSRQLVANHLADVTNGSTAPLTVKIPENYQTWKRVLGFYSFIKPIAESSIHELHQELATPFHKDLSQITINGELLRYQAKTIHRLEQKQISELLDIAYRNPLKIPQLKPNELANFFAHFAPVWEVDTQDDTDKIGMVIIKKDGFPGIDINKPIVYVNHSFTRFRDENLLQLIYQIWFPARRKTSFLDLYGGELDSVIWRITLNRQGQPIAYDSIHACGCYYMLFPAHSYVTSPATANSEPILSPQQINFDHHSKHLLIRLASGTHYLQNISNHDSIEPLKIYDLVSYQNLRTLPVSSEQTVNLFGIDGIIDSSSRLERFILWPFGVKNPGAMRQWGSHAIAFIGKRHFDDPFLLEKLMIHSNSSHSLSTMRNSINP